MEKVVLVDGNNLLFRSYYATAYTGNIMRNRDGFPTNGLYGFVNMINKIISEEKPEYMMVAFDIGKTFRHEKYERYKDGRRETPDDLKVQFPVAKKILTAMGIKYLECAGYEADDIIGTISMWCEKDPEYEALIVSSDKDLLQLISDETVVKLLKTKDYIWMDKKTFNDTYGFDPIHMIDLKALMGDASDNISGVKGIGEKTAITLLKKYGSLDEIYNNLENIGGKTAEKLETGKEDAYTSFDLATIYREVPIPFTLEECIYRGLNTEEYIAILRELEFKSLLKKISVSIDNTVLTGQQSFDLLEEKPVNKTFVSYNDFDFTIPFSFYLEMDGHTYSKSKIIGGAFTNKDNSCFMTIEEIINHKEIFNNDVTKYTYDVKRMIILLNQYDITINNCNYDAMIGAYLLDYKLDDDITVLMGQFNYDCPSYEETYGTERKKREASLETTKKQSIMKSEFIYDSREQILEEIATYNETKLFEEIEMPLAFVLADMELTGIRADKNYLLKQKEEQYEDAIKKLAKIIIVRNKNNIGTNTAERAKAKIDNKEEVKKEKEVEQNEKEQKTVRRGRPRKG